MTTVTIDDDTHKKLKMLKDERSASSFDELLSDLVEENLDIPSTDEMFGSMTIDNKSNIRDRNDRMDRDEYR